MRLLIIVIVVVAVVYNKSKARKEENKKMCRADMAYKCAKGALFEEVDADLFLYTREKYTDKLCVDNIEKALNEFRDYVNREFERREYMDKEQLTDLRLKYHLLCRVDEKNKDIWVRKFDSISALM